MPLRLIPSGTHQTLENGASTARHLRFALLFRQASGICHTLFRPRTVVGQSLQVGSLVSGVVCTFWRNFQHQQPSMKLISINLCGLRPGLSNAVNPYRSRGSTNPFKFLANSL